MKKNDKTKKILITQDKKDVSFEKYRDLEQKYNVTFDFVPFISIEDVSGYTFMKELIDLSKITSIIFTSKTAVDRFFQICKEIKYNVPDNLKYFCLSEAITIYISKYTEYKKRKLFNANGNAQELVDIILKHPTDKILFPLSNIQNNEIVSKLEENNVKFKKCTVYTTIFNDISKIKPDDYDMIVFFSTLSVQSFVKHFVPFKQSKLIIAAFGNNTAETLKDANLKVNVKAPKKDTPSMTLAIEKFLKK